MPWPMSCPSGEGRSQGEGAEAFSLGFNNPLRCRSTRAPIFGSAFCCRGARGCYAVGLDLSLSGLPPIFLRRPLSLDRLHAAMQRDAAGALQRRAPAAQSRRLRGMEPADVRGVQQPELPRAQLRAGAVGRGRDQSRHRLRDGPEQPEGPGPGAAAPAPGPQEPEPRRALVPGPDPDVGEHRPGLLARAARGAARRARPASPPLGDPEELCGL